MPSGEPLVPDAAALHERAALHLETLCVGLPSNGCWGSATAMTDNRFLKRLRKKRTGAAGWPLATIAFYGRKLSQATKAAVGIIPSEMKRANANADGYHRLRWLARRVPIALPRSRRRPDR